MVCAIVAILENAIIEGVITNQTTISAANEFMDWATSDQFILQDLTTPEDIKRANKIIELALTNTK